MDGLLATLSFGFLLGMQHSLDADHVVAVSTIVSENKTMLRSSFLGMLWGVGHSITLFLVGGLVLIFKLAIPPILARAMEFIVGLVLVILGFSLLWKLIVERVPALHLHFHRHKGASHIHLHSHEAENHGHNHERKSIITGGIQGLAGSAALMLLVLASIDTITLGLFFILVFGVGSILGMLIISTFLSLPFTYTTGIENINEKIRWAVGFISIFLGLSIMAEIYFEKGLFYAF
ncbi:MAG: hypothetical protein V3T58_04260 [Candidatus Hydrothermarchaeales archaeon]